MEINEVLCRRCLEVLEVSGGVVKKVESVLKVQRKCGKMLELQVCVGKGRVLEGAECV